MLGGEVLEIVGMHLKRRVVHKDVESPEGIQCPCYSLLAKRPFGDITRDNQTLPPFPFHGGFGHGGIGLLGKM